MTKQTSRKFQSILLFLRIEVLKLFLHVRIFIFKDKNGIKKQNKNISDIFWSSFELDL